MLLEGKVGSVELVNGGVLLKTNNRLLDLDGSNKCNERKKTLLNVSLFRLLGLNGFRTTIFA